MTAPALSQPPRDPRRRAGLAPETVAVALGSNLGDRASHLAAAVESMAALPLTSLAAASPVIETAPVGPVDQGPYLNAAVLLRTLLTPHDLLARLLLIERARGRDRAIEPRWGPRTLDLDILLFGDRVIDELGLTVPHPRLHERRFALEPLALVWPDALVPTLGRGVRELLAALP